MTTMRKKQLDFFTIVADDPKKHLKNITNLTDVLQDDAILQALLKTTSLDDYNQLICTL